MVLRIIEATHAKSGVIIIVDGEPYAVRNNDISKTGKHGASKCRIEAVGVFNGKKKILAVPGHERFEVPNVEKKRAQVLSIEGATDRKSTRLNSSHSQISYAVFCLKKKKN